MAFTKLRGKTKIIYVPVTVSTVMTKGDIVSMASGQAIRATSSTTALSHVGVAKKSILATDADYAIARSIPVEVPVDKNVVWLADVTATLVATDVGLEVDLTDSQVVNRGASTVDVCLVRELVSTTKAVVVLRLNGSY